MPPSWSISTGCGSLSLQNTSSKVNRALCLEINPPTTDYTRSIETSNGHCYSKASHRWLSRSEEIHWIITEVSVSDASRSIWRRICRNGEAYARSTITKLEPYAVQLGQDFRKRWFLLLKYIEGPVYDKTVEVAEQVRSDRRVHCWMEMLFPPWQIQQLSSVIFAKSVYYLNILFDAASYYTAHGAHLTEIYLRQVYAILHDKWTQ